MNKPQQKQNNNSDLLKYASLGTQLLASLGAGVFIGYKLDQWMHLRIPLLVWLLPLLILIGIIYKLVRETSTKNGKTQS